MSKIFRIAIIAIISISAVSEIEAQPVRLFSDPPSLPQLFNEITVNTRFSERDFALSPDGRELFYTLQAPVPGGFQTLVHRKKLANGEWSAAVLAPFAGRYSDLEPAFSPDGRKLFFASDRPVAGKEKKDFDIWVVDKLNDGWGEPQHLDGPLNTEKDEFYPSVTRNGHLYFTASYPNGMGKEDIYVSRFRDGKYLPPELLDSAVNSKTYEFNAFVSPDEQFIIFSSFGRKDEMGGGDLYMSIRSPEGNWKPAQHLTILNSDKIDYCPFVSANKELLFFTSERTQLRSNYPEGISYEKLIKSYDRIDASGGNIYWINFKTVLDVYK